MTTNEHMDKARAAATLATTVQRGETIYLIRRLAGRHAKSRIVDFRLASAPTHNGTGALIGALLGKQYLYHRNGLLIDQHETPEDIVQAVSKELFGDPKLLKAVWM